MLILEMAALILVLFFIVVYLDFLDVVIDLDFDNKYYNLSIGLGSRITSRLRKK